MATANVALPSWSSSLPGVAPPSQYPSQYRQLQPQSQPSQQQGAYYHTAPYPHQHPAHQAEGRLPYDQQRYDYNEGAHLRTHSLDSLYTSTSLPSSKKRTRSKLYPTEEARQAAKMVQKARRREQNRNAQRRLRDRKEEHIFKLEGEVSQLRREGEQQRAEVQGLEEMCRRLMGERGELQRKLEALGGGLSESWEGTTRLAPLVSPPSAGQREYESSSGYSSSARSGSTASSSADRESKESSASSVSVSTPRSPSFLSPTGEASRKLPRVRTGSFTSTEHSLYSSETGKASLPVMMVQPPASTLSSQWS